MRRQGTGADRAPGTVLPNAYRLKIRRVTLKKVVTGHRLAENPHLAPVNFADRTCFLSRSCCAVVECSPANRSGSASVRRANALRLFKPATGHNKLRPFAGFAAKGRRNRG